THKNILYSDFIDELGETTEIDLPGTGGSVPGNEFEQFHKKARHFLNQHLANEIVAKVRSGQPITPADIHELQRVLVAAGIGDTDTFAQASQRAGSFGLFIRSIVGLDRAAAKQAFARFLDDKRYTRNQIEFVNLVIDYLTQHGTIRPGRIYESPFTAVAPQGPETIFSTPDLDELFNIIQHLHNTAAA
ncbi:MAG: restriction endonuclease subunit R, partial [bacterium]|nr:restriction endonuclease subunit R [bacterium]